MKTLLTLTKRNIKIYFKDKGMFLVSLITPIILLILYVTFLGNIYKTAFTQNTPPNFILDENIINGIVGGQLISSILATSCVTISFCSNMIMVQDKFTGAIKDLLISPVKKSTLALSYFFASLFSALIVCYFTTALCLVYIAIVGWYLTFLDVVLILLDVLLLCLFGTCLSSIIYFFLKTQGQMSAVGSIVSSTYGFICGAYMPMSNFPEGLRNVLSLLPGTYGTVLLRNHAMSSALTKLNYPADVLEKIKYTIDLNINFFGTSVNLSSMYVYIILTIVVLLGTYVFMNIIRKNKVKK